MLEFGAICKDTNQVQCLRGQFEGACSVERARVGAVEGLFWFEGNGYVMY